MAGRAAINVGGEYLRQKGKAIQTGCSATDGIGLGFAAGASLLGDLGGKWAAINDVLGASNALHYLPMESESLTYQASLAISSIVQSTYSLAQRALH
jgi:hypothetical protein